MEGKALRIEYAGIDYGSKTAGTTVIAFPEAGGKICFAQSPVKGDADRFIRDWCAAHHPGRIYIDAPLSLPGVYRHPDRYDDYFYREADRAVSAMSPMFLGGLTARAMRLRAALRQRNIDLMEVYPGRLADELGLDRKQYKKTKNHLRRLTQVLGEQLPFTLAPSEVESWHHFDALLALLSGRRHQQGRHLLFGDDREGCIIV